jgi:hypothetical protein
MYFVHVLLLLHRMHAPLPIVIPLSRTGICRPFLDGYLGMSPLPWGISTSILPNPLLGPLAWVCSPLLVHFVHHLLQAGVLQSAPILVSSISIMQHSALVIDFLLGRFGCPVYMLAYVSKPTHCLKCLLLPSAALAPPRC